MICKTRQHGSACIWFAHLTIIDWHLTFSHVSKSCQFKHRSILNRTSARRVNRELNSALTHHFNFECVYREPFKTESLSNSMNVELSYLSCLFVLEQTHRPTQNDFKIPVSASIPINTVGNISSKQTVEKQIGCVSLYWICAQGLKMILIHIIHLISINKTCCNPCNQQNQTTTHTFSSIYIYAVKSLYFL